MRFISDEIHIALGDSAGGIIKETIHPKPGNFFIGLDHLSEGPLPALSNLNEWQRIRNDYHRTIYSEIDAFLFEQNEKDILFHMDNLKKTDRAILWLGSGLADQLFFIWIVQLFKLISVDLKKLRIIQFYRAPYADIDYFDWPGDHYLYYRLRRLGVDTLNNPLVKLTGISSKMRETEVSLTEVGQKVLDGELNNVEMNGIDEWVGGIHLQSQKNNVWYCDNDTLFKKQ